ncbi:MAG TPA: hypothetical protein VFH83_16810 [Spirochaetia bacterium]|nr:hypothetical protein [Spirochaetia bacterium]
MNRSKSARLMLFAPIVIILYLLLFPYPLGRELVAVPRWAASLQAPDQPGAASTASGDAQEAAPGAGVFAAPGAGLYAAPFRLGDLFGFVSPAGALVHLERELYQVTIAPTGFVSFGRLDTDWILRGPTGDPQGAYSSHGYPLLGAEGRRLLAVKTDLSGVQELAPTGDVLWSRDFPAPVTSASVEADLTAAGLLNGSLLVIDRQGAVVLDARPGPSRIRAIYGVSLSRDGKMLAAVSGIDPQRLTLWRWSGISFRVVESRPLPTSFRREVRIAFSPNGRILLLEGNAAVGAYRTVSHRLTWLPVPGAVRDVSFLEPEGTVALTAGSETANQLMLFEPPEGPILRVPVPVGVSLSTVKGQLLLGVPALPQGNPPQLLRLDVEAR